jgi:hypothetical protein
MAEKKQEVPAVVHELLRDIRELTGHQFIYEDPWHGFVPMKDGDTPADYHLGPLLPFAELGYRDKADVLQAFIKWDRYTERGLDWRDANAIDNNVTEGKPPDRWLEGTSFGPRSRQHGERSRQVPGQPGAGAPQTPAGGRTPELLETLQAAAQYCLEGLDCADPLGMEAALRDVLGKVRAAIALAREEGPAPGPGKRKDTGIGRDQEGRPEAEPPDPQAELARQLFGGGQEPGPSNATAKGDEQKTWAERVSEKPPEGGGDWLRERLRKLPDEQRRQRKEDDRGHDR